MADKVNLQQEVDTLAGKSAVEYRLEGIESRVDRISAASEHKNDRLEVILDKSSDDLRDHEKRLARLEGKLLAAIVIAVVFGAAGTYGFTLLTGAKAELDNLQAELRTADTELKQLQNEIQGEGLRPLRQKLETYSESLMAEMASKGSSVRILDKLPLQRKDLSAEADGSLVATFEEKIEIDRPGLLLFHAFGIAKSEKGDGNISVVLSVNQRSCGSDRSLVKQAGWDGVDLHSDAVCFQELEANSTYIIDARGEGTKLRSGSLTVGYTVLEITDGTT